MLLTVGVRLRPFMPLRTMLPYVTSIQPNYPAVTCWIGPAEHIWYVIGGQRKSVCLSDKVVPLRPDLVAPREPRLLSVDLELRLSFRVSGTVNNGQCTSYCRTDPWRPVQAGSDQCNQFIICRNCHHCPVHISTGAKRSEWL